MVFNLEPVNLILGMIIMFGIFMIGFISYKIFNRKEKKERTKTSLPTLKSYVKEAHNHMVESANQLIKLYEVFNEIDESKQ